MLEGKGADEAKTLQSVQIAVKMGSAESVLKVLQFMFSQLPPSFGKEVELKPAAEKPKEEATSSELKFLA